MELFDIVIKLTGPVEPVGETHTDNERFENLKKLLELMRELHMKVDGMTTSDSARGEFSIRRSGLECHEYLNWLGSRNDA